MIQKFKFTDILRALDFQSSFSKKFTNEVRVDDRVVTIVNGTAETRKAALLMGGDPIK